METIVNDTLKGLTENIRYTDEAPESLQQMAKLDARYLKDLKINVGNALAFDTLSEKESSLLALSVAINEKSKSLIASFTQRAIEKGATEAEISETWACTSLLNVNNVFYRFRHFTKKEFYTTTPAGIKMTIMGNPVMGKEFFELMSLAVSALNGCELCVNAHEESLIRMGSSQQRIYDAIRLAANIRGLVIWF
ncbi:MAG: alkylhydroperoxidase AhpD family core domain protein [Bacteroidetes bacterium]|jgi:alkyl hydroperoxide reductase subunit D|nr:alkylhydroperoxidase AhpD family core domain protein [Bacteroidota bacterium]